MSWWDKATELVVGRSERTFTFETFPFAISNTLLKPKGLMDQYQITRLERQYAGVEDTLRQATNISFGTELATITTCKGCLTQAIAD